MASIDRASQIRELRNFEAWAKQIWYWRTHLDRFIEEYFKIKLKPQQRVDARVFGLTQNADFVKNRGAGKTWLIAICCIAMGVLYPGSLIAVISSTAEQAVLVIKKIDDKFIQLEVEVIGDVLHVGMKPTGFPVPASVRPTIRLEV